MRRGRGPPSKADEGPWERMGGTAAAAEERPRLNIQPRTAKPAQGASDKPKVGHRGSRVYYLSSQPGYSRVYQTPLSMTL